jgi:hypothetical protein
MIGHSLISGGLFLLIGFIYDITNNKNVLLINNNILVDDENIEYLFKTHFRRTGQIVMLGSGCFKFDSSV